MEASFLTFLGRVTFLVFISRLSSTDEFYACAAIVNVDCRNIAARSPQVVPLPATSR